MGDDAFENKVRHGVDLTKLTSDVAAEVERVGEENRREIADYSERVERNEHYYCVGWRAADGSVLLQTVDEIAPRALDDDPGFREWVKLGKLEARGPNEQGALANMHHAYTRRLVDKKYCRREDAGSHSARVRFSVVDYLPEGVAP